MKQSWKTEILAGAGVALVLVSCLFLLWRDSHAADDDGLKVGAITYRFRIAQRRGGGSVVWRDVDLNSPVYNNNYVRTDAASEAVVTLNDRTRIELEPDSMIVLQVVGKRVKIGLNRGSVLLRRNKAGGRPLSITGKSGREYEVAPGNTRVDSTGDDIRIAPRDQQPVPLSPADNHRLFIADGTAAVDFTWREKENVVLEVSPSRSMTGAGIKRSVSGGRLRLNLPPGFHYWRIRAGKRASVPRRIRVVRKPVLLTDAPVNGETFTYSLRPPLVGFSWSPDPLAVAYVIRVARDPALRNTVAVMRAYRVGISRAFPAGTYYWRLETEGAVPGAESAGRVKRFVVRETKVPKRPVLIFPSPGTVLSRKTVEKNGILFRWSSGPDIARAELHILGADKKPLVSREVRDNHQRLGNDLKSGRYYWRIRLPGRAVPSELVGFQVIESDVPSVPPAKKTAPAKTLARPRAVFPRHRSVVDMSTRDFINFRWRSVPGAASYRFTLYHRGRILHRKTTRVPRLRFSDLSKLDTGSFSWLVIAQPATGSGKKPSRAGASFRITLSDGPDKPNFK